MHDLQKIDMQGNIKLCSFDITNMYTNIPQTELIQVINNALQNNSVHKEQKQEIITLTNTILNQNYFQHNDQQYKQTEGLAMGAPASAMLAEIFIQHLEHNHVINTLKKHHIIDYYRYVDDILIVYNQDHTNIDDVLNEFNSIHPNIQYTIEKQTNNKLNYLDITIENRHNTLTFGIYRKPTTTDIIIHNSSCHPHEHKNSAIKYLVNRMNTYPISEDNQHQELQHIKSILQNNNYPPQTYLNARTKKNKSATPNATQKKKWATFTYTGKETRAITRLFKNTDIQIAYRTKNTIQNHLKPKNHTTDIYNRSGIYELKCEGCQLKYIGQTGRNFKTRYREHIHAIRTNKPNSRYAQHILDTEHTYGTMQDTMEVLHVERKGPLLNTLERFHIYSLWKDNMQINDMFTGTHNPIFNIIKDHDINKTNRKKKKNTP
jgi:ribosomal protein S25